MEERLRALVTELISGSAVFLVDAYVHRGGENVVGVLVDTDAGISMDECAELNREIGRRTEEARMFDFPYRLEVGSPGLDKPFRILRQYQKNSGRRVKVKFNNGNILEGILKEVNENEITIETEKGKKETESREIPFSEIKETKIVVSFK